MRGRLRLYRRLSILRQQILQSNWEQQPLAIRFVNWLCYGLLRLMTEISGYASENSQTRDLTHFKDP